MSVQIKIGTGGSFPNTTVPQNELVFWLNDDGNKQSHYPIPRCENLEVAAGKSTSAFQPVATPALPANVNYICALHPNEKGLLVIDNDPGTTQSEIAPGTRVFTIDISPGGKFATVKVLQNDQVIWTNNDNKTHWPVPNCTGLKVAPQAVSNATQVLPPTAAPTLPMAIWYGCAIEGHESESGTINVFNNFVVAASPLTLSSASLNTPVPAATGGASPYNITQDPSVDYITAAETAPQGGSVGVSIALTKAPPAGTKSVQYQLTATDATGSPINSTITVNIT
jgi:hypothetical protein